MPKSTIGAGAAFGCAPVAADARTCPRCGARNPNPGLVNRFASRGMTDGRPADPHWAKNVLVQFPIIGLGTIRDLDRREGIEAVLAAELESFNGGECTGGDAGSGKAIVFLTVQAPAVAMPRQQAVPRRDGLLTDQVVVAEATGRGHTVWWPADCRGPFSVL